MTKLFPSNLLCIIYCSTKKKHDLISTRLVGDAELLQIWWIRAFSNAPDGNDIYVVHFNYVIHLYLDVANLQEYSSSSDSYGYMMDNHPNNSGSHELVSYE